MCDTCHLGFDLLEQVYLQLLEFNAMTCKCEFDFKVTVAMFILFNCDCT